MFENMKIKVENNLDEIVGELERLGFGSGSLFYRDCISIGIYPDYMKFDCYRNLDIDNVADCKLITLAELKEM